MPILLPDVGPFYLPISTIGNAASARLSTVLQASAARQRVHTPQPRRCSHGGHRDDALQCPPTDPCHVRSRGGTPL